MKPYDVRDNILRMITVIGFLSLLLLTGDVLVMGGDRIRPENVDAGGVVGIGEPVPDTASDPKSSNWPRVSGWTMKEVVTDESSHGSYHPSVAVGPDGVIHVDWTEYTHEWPATDDYAIFCRKRTGEGVWSEVEYVSTESYAAAWDASLAVDAQGTVHIAWEDHTYDYGNDRSDIFYKKKPESGEWTPTEVVTIETDMSSGDPVLAAEANGTVHAVWYDNTDYRDAGTDVDIFYKQKNPTPHAAENENLNTIIVPDDYSMIQEAIDHASDGMTVFVRRGTYEEKILVDKSIRLVGDRQGLTFIDGSGDYEDIVTLTADNIYLSGFTIQNSNRKGIYTTSDSHTITGNRVIETEIAIYLDYSSGNTILGNTVSHNDNFGIYVKNSTGNVISDNIIIDNHYAGIAIKDYSSDNIVIYNYIAQHPCYNDGIAFWNYPNDNLIAYNTVTDNCYGINLCQAADNTIINNNVSNNHWGIYLYLESDDNIFYHNNLSDNIVNAKDRCTNNWDNGYPSGGNYWDDYTGSDDYSGPDQNIPAPDGIGDVPYGFQDGALDNFPLMSPWDGSEVYIIDDSDPQFHILTGDWDLADHPYAFSSEARFTDGGSGNWMAAWKVDSVIEPGVYDVYVWKFEHEFLEYMSANTRYAVCHRNGISDWIEVDQSTLGNEWICLGSFEFDSSFAQGVTINNNADGYVMADAVKLVYTGSLE